MKKFSLKRVMWIGVLFASLAFTSCSSDDDSGDVGPSASGVEMIIDSDGLEIRLVWTVDGSTNPQTDVDLDFLVFNSDNEVVVSAEREGVFESGEFASFLADGTYKVTVDNLLEKGTAQYGLTVVGLNGLDSRIITGSVSGNPDADAEITVMTIEKTGTTFVFK